MQLHSSKDPGNPSCNYVKPRFAWTDTEISMGFECSHGTIIWLRLSTAEALNMAAQIHWIVDDINGVEHDEV